MLILSAYCLSSCASFNVPLLHGLNTQNMLKLVSWIAPYMDNQYCYHHFVSCLLNASNILPDDHLLPSPPPTPTSMPTIQWGVTNVHHGVYASFFLDVRAEFDLASEYLHQMISDEAGELVLDAARLHFNAAATIDDPSLDTAKKWWVTSSHVQQSILA